MTNNNSNRQSRYDRDFRDFKIILYASGIMLVAFLVYTVLVEVVK
jgi:hypothetical protein